jgi:hypothetical protein
MPAGSVCDIPGLKAPLSDRDLLVHRGRILDRHLSLEFQHVRDGDTILFYHGPDPRRDDPPSTSLETKMHSILLEVLKINDTFYRALETDPRGGILLKQCGEADAELPWDPFPLPPDETVIPKKTALSEAPLPMADSDDSEEEDSDDFPLSLFGSIEEAGEFFSKLACHGWIW